jgi:hypothetical protein
MRNASATLPAKQTAPVAKSGSHKPSAPPQQISLSFWDDEPEPVKAPALPPKQTKPPQAKATPAKQAAPRVTAQKAVSAKATKPAISHDKPTPSKAAKAMTSEVNPSPPKAIKVTAPQAKTKREAAAPARIADITPLAGGEIWRMAGKNGVAYVTSSALAGQLLATDPRNLIKKAMAVYYDKKGRAYAWQIRFDTDRWEEVAQRLG